LKQIIHFEFCLEKVRQKVDRFSQCCFVAFCLFAHFSLPSFVNTQPSFIVFAASKICDV